MMQKLSWEGSKKVTEFSWDKAAEKTLNAYSKVLKHEVKNKET
jgi:hypothetical protein